MAYAMKELSCDPVRIKGMSEKLIVSHYENNYGGAVNRLNAITAQLAELDFATAPGFVINGLKREELIASNSMILHELISRRSARRARRRVSCVPRSPAISEASTAGAQNSPPWVKRKAAAPGGCC
jgi:hypothetical protein